jgi:putative transposase
MIDRDHALPISRQAEALGVSRGAVYYKPRPVSAADLKIMRRLDELHLDYPFAGSRMLRDLLEREGISIGRRHVTSLMRRMGISAIYRRPNTSKPAPGHEIYPYLLDGVKIERANQVWATDITYIPMARGFVYLTAVVDVFSRRVLSHRLLRRGAGGGSGQAWQTGDFQYRPGQPIHQRRFYRRAARSWRFDQHGRQGRLARQRVRRAAMAQRQIRGGLLESLRQRRRGARLDRPLLGFLQSAAPALEP